MSDKEEFEKWFAQSGYYDHVKSDMERGWQARQPEIDALKAENERLRKATEEFLRVSLLADHRFLSDEHDRYHALAVKNLRAALEGK